MRKEVLFAILAGGVFGLIIAFGIWRLNLSITDNETSTEASPTPASTEFSLTIAKPNSDQVITTSSVSVSGITSPNSSVVVSGEEEDYFVTSDAKGEFEAEVDLTGGINDITVYSFDSEKKIAEEKVRIVYSSEFEDYLESDTDDSESEESEKTDASNSADEIREKVQEKVKDVQKNSSFYIGTVTDIAEETIQIKLDSGEIEQSQVSGDTTYVSNTKTSKSIEFEDVAIGDFIIAMGFKNGNGVLDTKRIVVTTIPESFDKKALIGTAQVESSKELILTSENQEFTVIFGKSWKGPDLNELEDNQLVIVIGESSEDVTARSLFVVEN